MRGKVGLVIGLGVGYVLGTRAGRQRYEQIKSQALKVWHLDPVQAQVEKVKDAGRSAALALPRALWAGVTKLVRSASETSAPESAPVAPAPAATKKPVATKPAARKPAAKAPAQTKDAAIRQARKKIDEAEGPAVNDTSGED